MSASDLEQKLQAGIEAAQRGNRATARRLLEQVVTADPDNEIAWMWLASVSDTLNDRRTALRRVLALNPDNERARQALNQLGGERVERDRQTVDRLRELRRGSNRGTTTTSAGPPLGVLIGGALLAVGAIAGVIFLLSLGSQPTPDLSTTPTLIADITDAQQTIAALPPTAAPTNTPFTITPRDSASIARAIPTLPPTLTATPTATATETSTPSVTPFPLTSFSLYFVSLALGEPQPQLQRADGLGNDAQPLGVGILDIAFDATGEKIAFTRIVDYADSGEAATAPPAETTPDGESTAEPLGSSFPEIFVAPANDLGAARQITTLRSPRTSAPSWAPDGIQLAFSSDFDGDEEIYVITEDGQNLRQITFNDQIDRQPAWSPIDGDNRIFFAGGRFGSSATDIYSISSQAVQGDTPTQLTEQGGSSFAPVWSPDGSVVAYLNNQGGDADVYLMNADGSDKRLLTQDDGGAEDRAVTFTPDSRLVVFASLRDGSTFRPYALDLRGREIIPLFEALPAGQSVLFLAFQPDSRFR